YADLAAESGDALKQVASPDVTLTSVKEWKVLGQPIARPNTRDIVTGSHAYPYDVTRPGMLYAKVLRPPGFGAKLTSIDIGPAETIDGVDVVRDGDFVGVTAPTTYAAKQ